MTFKGKFYEFDGKYHVSMTVSMAKALIKSNLEDLAFKRYCKSCDQIVDIRDIENLYKCPVCKGILKQTTQRQLWEEVARLSKGTEDEFPPDYYDWVYGKAYNTLTLAGIDPVKYVEKLSKDFDKKSKKLYSKIKSNKDMSCSKCGAKIPRTSKFCMECGYKFK